MCFTVALVRNNKLVTAHDYYNNLPVVNQSNNSIPPLPLYYFINGFSHPQLPIIKDDGVFLFEWGLIPSWVKDDESAKQIQSKTLNAKGETIFEKPSFKNCILSQRCILPIVGFYEWQDVNGVKYPYFIEPSMSDHFLLASIYDSWIDNYTGEIKNTFSILTTEANPLMKKIHNINMRMPLIMSDLDASIWLDKNLNKKDIDNLIKPYSEDLMKAYTISRIANDNRRDRNIPEITEEVVYHFNVNPTLF